MAVNKIEVGQFVRHIYGFYGEVVSVNGYNATVRISHINDDADPYVEGRYKIGEEAVVKRVNLTDVNAPVNKVSVMGISVDVTGLEELKEVVDVESESTVFKASMGNGMDFEGTKRDFDKFIDGVIRLFEFTNLMNK